jgi:uncharacterized protein YcbK (DUF882 family)
MTGDLTENFSRAEFACKCGCGFDTVDHELLEKLEVLRGRFDRTITITSGCRCPDHNTAVGGSDGSQHLLGRAADIVVQGIDPALVREAAEELGFGGIGEYDDFSHLDTRVGYARW